MAERAARVLYQYLQRRYPLAEAAVAVEFDVGARTWLLQVTLLTSFDERMRGVTVPAIVNGFDVEMDESDLQRGGAVLQHNLAIVNGQARLVDAAVPNDDVFCNRQHA